MSHTGSKFLFSCRGASWGGVEVEGLYRCLWICLSKHIDVHHWGSCTCVNKCVRPWLHMNITFLPCRDARQRGSPASSHASCAVMLHLTYTSSRLNCVWVRAGAKCSRYGVDRVTAEVGLAGLSPPQQCVRVWPLLHSLAANPALGYCCYVALSDYLQHTGGDQQGAGRWKGRCLSMWRETEEMYILHFSVFCLLNITSKIISNH